MSDSITVLTHFYRLMTPDEKTDLMNKLQINSPHTIRRYTADPFSMSIRQGIIVIEFIKSQFDFDLSLGALGKSVNDLIKESDAEGRRRITRRIPNFQSPKA